MTIWTVTLTIQDEKSQRAKHKFYVNDHGDTSEISEVIDLAAVYAQLLDPFITGVITNVNVTGNIALLPGMKPIPDTISDVEEGVLMSYGVNGLSELFSHRIPTFREDLMATPTSLVDYYTVLGIDGSEDPFFLMGATLDWNGAFAAVTCDSRGATLFPLQKVRENFKRSRR